jgi:RsiW-degrading membrane proteinase PrsW (M82 family)
MKHMTQKQRGQQQYAKRKKMFVLAFCVIVIPSMLVMFAQALAHLCSGDRSIAWRSYGQPVSYFLLLVISGFFLSLAVIMAFRAVMSKPENHKSDDVDGPSS